MPPVGFDDLSDDVQRMIAALETKVHDPEFEANFYRAAALIAFLIMAERIWDRFLS